MLVYYLCNYLYLYTTPGIEAVTQIQSLLNEISAYNSVHGFQKTTLTQEILQIW